MAKQDMVEALLDEIMKEVSLRVREIIREEIEIETKRFRRKILREVNAMLVEHRSAVKKPAHLGVKRVVRPQAMNLEGGLKPARVIETGNSILDEVLQETEGDPEMVAGIDLKSASNPFQEVARQLSEDRKKSNVRDNGNGELWRPPPGQGYDFDPMKMDPAQIDWSHIVDKLDEHDKKSNGPL